MLAAALRRFAAGWLRRIGDWLRSVSRRRGSAAPAPGRTGLDTPPAGGPGGPPRHWLALLEGRDPRAWGGRSRAWRPARPAPAQVVPVRPPVPGPRGAAPAPAHPAVTDSSPAAPAPALPVPATAREQVPAGTGRRSGDPVRTVLAFPRTPAPVDRHGAAPAVANGVPVTRAAIRLRPAAPRPAGTGGAPAARPQGSQRSPGPPVPERASTGARARGRGSLPEERGSLPEATVERQAPGPADQGWSRDPAGRWPSREPVAWDRPRPGPRATQRSQPRVGKIRRSPRWAAGRAAPEPAPEPAPAARAVPGAPVVPLASRISAATGTRTGVWGEAATSRMPTPRPVPGADDPPALGHEPATPDAVLARPPGGTDERLGDPRPPGRAGASATILPFPRQPASPAPARPGTQPGPAPDPGAMPAPWPGVRPAPPPRSEPGAPWAASRPATSDRWPRLPDDAPLWTPVSPALDREWLRRLDDEQRGRPWSA